MIVDGSGFGVRGSGLAVRDSGLAVRGSGLAVRGSGLAVRGSRFADRPQPSTLNPQPSTVYEPGPQPSTLNSQRSRIPIPNPQRSANLRTLIFRPFYRFLHQPSTINPQPSQTSPQSHRGHKGYLVFRPLTKHRLPIHPFTYSPQKIGRHPADRFFHLLLTVYCLLFTVHYPSATRLCVLFTRLTPLPPTSSPPPSSLAAAARW